MREMERQLQGRGGKEGRGEGNERKLRRSREPDLGRHL